jgi:hydroxymethylbilane synthase
MATQVRIGSRPSQLALAQTGLIARQLRQARPDLEWLIVPISTTGDRLSSPSLAQIGGKGLFVRELEQALLEKRIDLAIHSMKDLPAQLAPQFRLVAVPAREDAADVLIGASDLPELPARARLGTASLRRRFEALRLRPDLDVRPLRGNVDSRLAKLTAGEFDAIILALAGLKRLGRASDLAWHRLPERDFVPAGGQGALALQALNAGPVADSAEIERTIVALDDSVTRCEIEAERAFLAAMGASCASPVGVRAWARPNALTLRASLFSLDGARWMGDEVTLAGSPQTALVTEAARTLAERMIANGAHELIL